MKKNLKKVLSAVIAMALAFSLVPASFAAKVTLSDVADTASYATAVNTLVALNVINGYEDGTFLPDNKITRAEATKVMVAALNQLDAAEGMKGATQFTDVESRHEWATGYINAGVQNGYINGMGDGTFAPDAEVTYAQMVKMLVSAMNYDQYATYLGGYPTGYLSIAGSEGITDGVNANANDAVTRAQVAQLVYNALNTPIVENTGMTWTSDGKLVPTIAKQNGKEQGGNDTYYKSILTEYFNAYYVEGFVLATERTGEKKGEVKFGFAKTEDYDHETLGAENMNTNKAWTLEYTASQNVLTNVAVGDTDAADYQGVYASAIIMEDEYEDLSLISFVPSGKNKTVKVDADLVDSLVGTELEVYASENATKTTGYKLAKTAGGAVDVAVYVNGVQVPVVAGGDPTDDDSAALVNKYVVPAAVGEVELVDTYKTDGYYDKIFVKQYATAMFDTYIESSKQLAFKDCTEAVGVIVLDEEANEDLVYNVYLNGEKITLAELQEDDILSIAYDVTAGISGSDFYDIYVSRDVKTGKYTAKDTEDNTVVIAGEEYKFVGGTIPGDLVLANEYTIYVDAFGRIYKKEVNASAAKYAVAEKIVWSDTYDAYRLTMFTVDGEQKTVSIDDTKVNMTTAMNGVYSSTTGTTPIVGGTKKSVQNRAVAYKIASSTGMVSELTFLTIKDSETTPVEYSKDRVGSIKLNDATKVVNAVKYVTGTDAGKISSYAVASKADFAEDSKYAVYAYGDKVDSVYPFVIITHGEGVYGADTHFAVIAGSIGTGIDDAGNDIYNIPVAYADAKEVTTLIGSDDLPSSTSSLNVGDVIFYQVNAEGKVEDIDVIFSVDSSFETMVENTITKNYLITASGSDFSTDFTTDFVSSNNDDIQLILGPVVAKNGSEGFTIADVVNFKTNLRTNEADGGVYEVDLSSDTQVYTYDYAKNKDKVTKGVASSILNSIFTKEAYENDDVDTEVLDWADAQSKKNVNLAFAKIVDGEATDVLVITGEYKATAPVYAKADFSAPAATTALFDKTAADLATGINVTANAITATLTEIADWSTVYPAGENSGYYVPVHFVTPVAGTFTATRKLAGSVVSTKSHTTTAGEAWDYIVRVAGTDEVEVADEIVFTFSATGATPVTYTFALPTVE